MRAETSRIQANTNHLQREMQALYWAQPKPQMAGSRFDRNSAGIAAQSGAQLKSSQVAAVDEDDELAGSAGNRQAELDKMTVARRPVDSSSAFATGET